MIDNLNGVNYDWEDIYQRWYGLVKRVKDGLEAGIVGILLNFVLVLIYCMCVDMAKERSIMWIDPRILSKIYEQRWFDNKYISQRFYSSPVKQSFNNYLHDSNFDIGHLHHVINIGQAVLKEKEESVIRDSIMEVSFFEENLVKKNLSCFYTENFYKKDYVSEVELKLNFFYKNKLVKEENKNLFLSDLNKKFVCEKVVTNKKEINFVAINNLTTSPRNNSIMIIEPGKILEGSLLNGLFMFPKKTLIFLLEGSEDYRKCINLLVYGYSYDRYNARHILNAGAEEVLRIKSEGHVSNIMGGLGYNVEKYKYFGINSGVKMLDYLVEKMEESKKC